MAANEGIYLYCFARSDSVSGLELIGVDGRQGVEAIEAGGIAAVCSRVSLDEFRDDPAQNQVPDPQWLIPRACRHESVIEAVMTRSPVLPVRFGALFSSPFALQASLRLALPQIGRFLAYAADKQEWTVKGFVDSKMAETWLLESDPALVARRQSLPESPGMRYFQQKQLAAAAQQQVKQSAAHGRGRGGRRSQRRGGRVPSVEPAALAARRQDRGGGAEFGLPPGNNPNRRIP